MRNVGNNNRDSVKTQDYLRREDGEGDVNCCYSRRVWRVDSLYRENRIGLEAVKATHETDLNCRHLTG